MTDRLEEAQLETSITAEEAAQALVKLAAHRPKDAEEVLTELIANVYIASGLHSLLAWSSAEDRVNAPQTSPRPPLARIEASPHDRAAATIIDRPSRMVGTKAPLRVYGRP
jgi:hypothetical protein